MTKTIETTLADRLTAALDRHARAKLARPEDNPFHDRDLTQLQHVGLVGADRHPAVNMVTKAPDMVLAHDLEEARTAANTEAKADKSARRMADARARRARKEQFDKIANSPTQPSKERMAEAWAVMAHLFPTVVRIAESKRKWAARHLGDVSDDVSAAVLESMALMLAKSDQDLTLLEVAASEIAAQAKRSGKVPGDQQDDDERKERRRIRRARKWLMQVVNNRVMDTLIDVYFRSHNLKWDNIDRVATVIAAINGPGNDPMMTNFKADRAPAFQGARFQRPDGIDSGLLATAISAAIADRGLDRLTELMLNEENVRTDGAFMWSEKAQDVFLCAPEDGQWMWDQIVRATTGVNAKGKPWTMDRARKARADAARVYVRSQFDWLPGFIVSVIDSFDPQMIGWSSVGRRAVMASVFELFYLPERDERRLSLEPALRFGSTAEAARVLTEHLAQLTTADDLIASVVNA